MAGNRGRLSALATSAGQLARRASLADDSCVEETLRSLERLERQNLEIASDLRTMTAAAELLPHSEQGRAGLLRLLRDNADRVEATRGMLAAMRRGAGRAFCCGKRHIARQAAPKFESGGRKHTMGENEIPKLAIARTALELLISLAGQIIYRINAGPAMYDPAQDNRDLAGELARTIHQLENKLAHLPDMGPGVLGELIERLKPVNVRMLRLAEDITVLNRN